ncbi:hypothetical protein ES708_31367 [subsurface metagenome]
MELRVVTIMTTPEPLYLCQRIFGGKVLPRKVPAPWQPQYQLSYYGKRCETLLRAVEPYLIIKKEKANLALSFLACGRGITPRKRELAELITPQQTKSHNVITS